MSVNDQMTINQAASVFNAVMRQATGQDAIADINTANFVSVAQTTLRTGYDPILNALGQVLSGTIFSVRPYEAKFKGLKVSQEAYGNHVRKLSVADSPVHIDAGFAWPVAYDSTQSPPSGDGNSVDMYTIKKPDVLQTNFYSRSTWQDHVTVFKNQIDVALSGPAEFGRFVSMTMQNMSDKHEMMLEDVSRAVVANFIGGILAEGQSSRVVHLLTEYNALTGGSYTAQTIYQPANFKAFMQWVYSRVMQISSMMTERSQMYQTVINAKPVMRHTPKRAQKMYLFAPAMFNSEMMAIANTFNSDLVQIGDHEVVNFWQSIETPDSIAVTPAYVGTNGAATVGSAQEQAGIFGVIADEEAMGFAEFNADTLPTPLNARGRYTNYWMHSEIRAWNDHTEKGVVLLLD